MPNITAKIVGGGGSASATNTHACAMTGTLDPGDLVVIVVSIRDTGITESVASITGHSITFALVDDRSSGDMLVEVWIGRNGATAVVNPSFTVTATGNPSGTMGSVACAFNDTDPADTVDRIITGGGPTASPSIGPTDTTRRSEEVAILGIAWQTSAAKTGGPDNDFSEATTVVVGASQRLTIAYKVLSAVGTATVGYTLGASVAVVGVLMTLRAKPVMQWDQERMRG